MTIDAQTKACRSFDPMASETKAAVSKANLVALPYELRQQIFRHYFRLDGGYIYDGQKDKLVTADRQVIDLSLMYTCRSIADDTKHLPLGVNAITFSTTYRADWRQQAVGLAFVVNYHRMLQADVIIELRRFMTPEIYLQLGLRFPQCVPAIKTHLATFPAESEDDDQHHFDSQSTSSEHLGNAASFKNCLSDMTMFEGIQSETRIDMLQYAWGETSFSASAVIAYTFRLLAEKHPAEVSYLIDYALPGWTDSHSLDEFSHLSFDPWAIPSLSEVAARGHDFRAQDVWDCLEEWHEDERHRSRGTGIRYREKLFFSAAAVAIRFLNRLPKSQRLYLRNIIINENRISVGFPECHVIGLISFCRDNPKLHVESRVSLWRSILMRYNIPTTRDSSIIYRPSNPPRSRSRNTYIPDLVVGLLRQWVLNALEAVDLGMPQGSFSFVLDGDPDLDLSSNLFDTVIRPGLAWEKARQATYGPRTDPWDCRDLARGIEPLFCQNSIFGSNFDLGQPWDYLKLIEQNRPLSEDFWNTAFGDVLWGRFKVFNPALDETTLQCELFEQEKQCDYLDSSHNMSKSAKQRVRMVRRRWAAAIAEAGKETVRASDGDSKQEAGTMMQALFREEDETSPHMTAQKLDGMAQE